jgi:hypothetical protein
MGPSGPSPIALHGYDDREHVYLGPADSRGRLRRPSIRWADPVGDPEERVTADLRKTGSRTDPNTEGIHES